ncbi:hypothetical protein [Alicyclobacillus ferrooxydans]|uniref:DUF4829 domain-containing protein n=1 Tax=Alicyclobacillus ferrooxydans TaxID=471514 RepID=A0A0P9EIT7_9BACL|nr:hypothetical protein [Alicyclobacillus ferrooxydans]KPV42766.1 hypothetical protein AN477_15565 [Alicyclobacillus ferrooxydans]
MKRMITGISLIALTSMGFITGCATNTTNQANTSATNSIYTNTTTPAAGSGNATATGSGNVTGTSGSAGNAASTSSNPVMTDAQMKTVAKDLVDRYLQSHNDKTAAEYQVDITQILIPGLAQAVASAARSGVDYNHPIQSSAVTVESIQYMNPNSFGAIANANIHFKDGKTEQTKYHLILALDPGSQQWLIRSIG